MDSAKPLQPKSLIELPSLPSPKSIESEQKDYAIPVSESMPLGESILDSPAVLVFQDLCVSTNTQPKKELLRSLNGAITGSSYFFCFFSFAF